MVFKNQYELGTLRLFIPFVCFLVPSDECQDSTHGLPSPETTRLKPDDLPYQSTDAVVDNSTSNDLVSWADSALKELCSAFSEPPVTHQ